MVKHRDNSTFTLHIPNEDRVPKQGLKYIPQGRTDSGSPKKKWKDQLHSKALEVVNYSPEQFLVVMRFG
jgi:hypothetical protein